MNVTQLAMGLGAIVYRCKDDARGVVVAVVNSDQRQVRLDRGGTILISANYLRSTPGWGKEAVENLRQVVGSHVGMLGELVAGMVEELDHVRHELALIRKISREKLGVGFDEMAHMTTSDLAERAMRKSIVMPGASPPPPSPVDPTPGWTEFQKDLRDHAHKLVPNYPYHPDDNKPYEHLWALTSSLEGCEAAIRDWHEWRREILAAVRELEGSIDPNYWRDRSDEIWVKNAISRILEAIKWQTRMIPQKPTPPSPPSGFGSTTTTKS